jgi:GNAT superfamily N-acetyltransferase
MPHTRDAVIREREAGDLQACVELLRQVHERDRYPVHWPTDPVAFLTPADELVTWVATRDGVLVGHVMLATAPEGLAALSALADEQLARSENLLLLRQLFVAPAARGQRLGSKLLDVATAEAAARGRRAALEVLSINVDAIKLYERAGWTAVGRTTPHWVPDGMHAVVLLAPS